MKQLVRALACITLAAAAGGCWPGSPYGSTASQYIHRSDTITLSAGNAKDVNAATQVIDPWPRYVGKKRIPANGERMVGAVQRYQRAGTARPGQVGPAGGLPGQAGGLAPGAPPPVTPSGATGTPPATLPY